ncbi:MAG: RHS repeat protein, partial [Gemmataceae bacterium]|nr:RHS repeat protein [Gemmataceae bacterium]
MTRLNRESSVMRLGLCAALLLAATAARRAVADQILEIHDDSLTTYQASTANGQNIRPLVDQRGVNIDGALRVGAGPPMSLSGNPFGESWDGNSLQSGMRLDTGTYSITDVDLALPAPGFSWVIGRSYNVRQFNQTTSTYYDSNGYQGKNWFQLSQPEIVVYEGSDDSKDMVYLIYGADRFIEFKRKTVTSNRFKAVNGAAGVMDFQADPSGPDTYVYTDQRGWQHYFYGFDSHSGITPAAIGNYWKTVAPGPGFSTYEAAVSYVNSPAYPGIVTATDSAGRSYDYTYTSGRLTKVEVEAGDPSQIVAEVHYSYYANGDLELVTIKTPLTEDDDDQPTIDTKWLIRKKHYRYYSGGYDAITNPGNNHHLKYIIDFEGYRRYDWLDQNLNNDSPLDVVDDNLLKPYASAYFEYEDSNYALDKHRRITKAWFNGSCGCPGTSSGTYVLSYQKNDPDGFQPGYDDEWYARTVVRQPDVQFKTADPAVKSYITQYFDETGQPLSRVLTNDDPSGPSVSVWATHVVRGATDGLITSIHSPANVTTYAHNEAGGDPDGLFTLNSNAGLVTVFTRKTSTDLKGFLEDTKHRQGANVSNPAFLDATLEYTSASKNVGGDVTVTRPFVNESWVYSQATTVEAGGGSGPAGAYKTTFDPLWFPTGPAVLTPQQVTTTYNAVSTANNGSGTPTNSKSYMDEAGRRIWEKTTDGIINYWRYRTGDGQLEKTIEDADTGHPDFTNCTVTIPDGFESSGTPMHLVTCYSYKGGIQGFSPPLCIGCQLDAEGNTSTTGFGPTAVSYTARLGDGRLVTLGFPRWEVQTGNYYGPVSYSVTNHAGQIELEGVIKLTSGAFTTADPTSFIDEGDADLRDAVAAIGTVAQMTRHHYSQAGHRLLKSWEYSVIPTSGDGVEGQDYDEALYGYDDLGRITRSKDPTTTIQRTVYDTLGRVMEQWLGTNDKNFAGGETAGTDNMVKTAAFEYDGNAVGGNSYLTKQYLFVQSGTIGQRETNYQHDLRGNVLLQINSTEPKHFLNKYDNLNRLIASGLYKSGTVSSSDDPTVRAADRLSLSQAFYDELGRPWKTQTHKIDYQLDGSNDDNLQALKWYDAAGRLIKVDGPQLAKTLYDRLGRITRQFILAQDDDTGYLNADDVDGDTVLQESQTVYGPNTDDVLMTAVIDRHHDDYSLVTPPTHWLGALDTNGDNNPLIYTAANIKGRIQITTNWYDNLERLTDTALFGNAYDTDNDNNSSTFTRTDLGVPPRSDNVLVTSYTFNTDGTLQRITDPMGIITQYEYDAAGRQTKEIRNYDGGGPGGTIGDEDQTVTYQYLDGLLWKMTADLPEPQPDQVTEYDYGVSGLDTDGPSKFDAGHLLRKVVYPPQTAGQVETYRRVLYAYNAQGQEIWTRDQETNVVETDFDDSGRAIQRRVTSLLSPPFDGAVRRIGVTYDVLGRTQLVTQYDNIVSGNSLDEVKYSYDDWGNVSKIEQDRNSAVGVGSPPDDYEISYTYAKATAGRNTIRRAGMTMPSGTSVVFRYAAYSFGNHASRVTGINVGASTPVLYWYNGVDQLVGTEYPEPDVMWNQFGSSSGTYPDLDRFNRVTSSRWTKDLSTDRDFYDLDIQYDADSNVKVVDDLVQVGIDVAYTLDKLNRLRKAEEGTWTGTITSPIRKQLWENPLGNVALDQAGNWDHVRLALNLNVDSDYSDPGEYDDDRTHSDANELKTRNVDNSGPAEFTLVHDKLGNLTDDGQHYEYVYDAFGRLRQVKNTSNQNLVAEYRYNGLGHRIGWRYDVDGLNGLDANDPWFYFAYDERWRMVATFRGDDLATKPKEQFVCHNAGLNGLGGSLSVDGVILRDRDNTGGWNSPSDGILEERRYYCQDWHGDVVVILTHDG